MCIYIYIIGYTLEDAVLRPPAALQEAPFARRAKINRETDR